MFEQSFLDAAAAGKKGASMLVSVIAQLFVLCVLIAIPVFYTQGLPQLVLKAFVVAPPEPRAASAPEPPPATQSARSQPRLLDIQ